MAPGMQTRRRARDMMETAPTSWQASVAAAVAGVAAMTLLLRLIFAPTHIANISMLYLLVVLGEAVLFGRGAAILASVLAFFAFDWFFVEPHFTFTVTDPAEWLSLFVFLVTAVVTGQLTALFRSRAGEARMRERETAALADASWAIASQVSGDRALAEVLRRLAEVVELDAAAILARDGEGKLEVLSRSGPHAELLPDFNMGLHGQAARLVLEQGQPIGWEGDRRHWDKAFQSGAEELSPGAAPDRESTYLPLTMEHRVLGALYLRLPSGPLRSPDARRVVESLANHAAVVLERTRLTRLESHAEALQEADRLKTALLSMVSHDFRSPLASIQASASGLLQEGVADDPSTQRELLLGITQATDRLDRMVGNILALSRLDADAWRPRCEDTLLEEVIEAARAGLPPAENRRVRVTLPADLPEVWLDPVQISQVLLNLMENALKYSPPEAPVELRAEVLGDTLRVEVLDRGVGLDPARLEAVFERFYRAPGLGESSVPGLGIGLSVCRGLAEAHGGTLTAAPREGGGSVFRLTLPLRGASGREQG